MAQTIHFINNYGYLAIFIIVFLQEIGLPTMIPNEISLLFFGYLCFTGLLNILCVLIVVIFSDLCGALLLNIIAYHFSSALLNKQSKWSRHLNKKIHSLKLKIEQKGASAILIGRVTPFIRSYISIASGTLKIHPFKYCLIALITACLYTGSFVFLGWILGARTKELFISNTNHILTAVALLIIILATCYFYIKRTRKSNT